VCEKRGLSSFVCVESVLGQYKGMGGESTRFGCECQDEWGRKRLDTSRVLY